MSFTAPYNANAKLSVILRAAKSRLHDGTPEFPYATYYICHAIARVHGLEASACDPGSYYYQPIPAIELLIEAGMPADGSGFVAFNDVVELERHTKEDSQPLKQAWRHAWLDLMIQFCEGEGL